MKIHKEGFKIITFLLLIVSVSIAFVAFVFSVPQWLVIILCVSGTIFLLLIALFFRVPVRNAAYADHKIFSGADGKVVVIEEVWEDEYFSEKRLQVSVFMSVTNVHVNFSPLKGVVKYFKYHPGRHFFAWLPKSSVENERTTLVIENEITGPVMIRQIAGAFARRIVCFPRLNNQIAQGSEIGIIKFGSRVDILLPINSKIHVSLNQHVRGGETLIASIP